MRGPCPARLPPENPRGEAPRLLGPRWTEEQSWGFLPPVGCRQGLQGALDSASGPPREPCVCEVGSQRLGVDRESVV